MARFAFKFGCGTRKALASIRCAMYVRASDGTTVLCESDSSSAFVVSTNDNQWEAAAGVLAQYELFGGGARTDTRWPHVVNCIQRWLLHAGRAHVRKDGRARLMSPVDVSYLHRKFFNEQERIAPSAVATFWKWFGPTLAAIRFQRPIGSLWHSGLLYGLLTRTDVEQTLASHNVGVFMLRFSERNPGQIGVAYVGNGRVVRHYLISSTDVVGPKRTVVDFIMEQTQFQSLLQYNETDDGRIEILPVPKQVVLKDLAHHTPPPPAQEGYEPLM